MESGALPLLWGPTCTSWGRFCISEARTIHRSVSKERKRDLPPATLTAWEAFKAEYNATLQEWKSFTQRFDWATGYGTQIRAEPVTPLL